MPFIFRKTFTMATFKRSQVLLILVAFLAPVLSGYILNTPTQALTVTPTLSLNATASPTGSLTNNDGSAQIVEIANEVLVLDFAGAGQSFPNKAITLKLTINPKVDVAKATVDWIYNDYLFQIDGSTQEIIDLRINEPKTLYKTFFPDQRYVFNVADTYDFGVRVAAAAYDQNYLSVRKIDLALNSDFEVYPFLAGYEQQRNIVNIIYFVLGVLLTAFVVILSSLGIRKFKEYLNSENN